MVERQNYAVDADNPFVNRKWYCHYVFDPVAISGEKRKKDFIYCVHNMFHAMTAAYNLSEPEQIKYLQALNDDLSDYLMKWEEFNNAARTCQDQGHGKT